MVINDQSRPQPVLHKTQFLMKTLVIVKVPVSSQAVSVLSGISILVEIDFFIFNRPPKPFRQNIINGSPTGSALVTFC